MSTIIPVKDLPLHNFRVIVCLLGTAWLSTRFACRPPGIVETPVDNGGSQQAHVDPDAVERGPRVKVSINDLAALNLDAGRDRWLRIEEIVDGAQGGWATGGFMPGNKVMVETENVKQFALDLRLIPIDWSRRVILRIGGHTSELTRKYYPELHLRRSPTGGWIPVKDHDVTHSP